MRQERSSSPRWGTGFWGRSASSWLCGLLLLAACLGFYSNVFRLIPGRRQTGESRSTEGRPLQGQRESLPSSQDGRRVVPQGMLLETKQCSERDCPPDACRVPEVPRMVYPKAQLLQPARADVLVMTPWFAPVIWDGVFDSAILDAQFENTTVGLTIFAIKKETKMLLTLYCDLPPDNTRLGPLGGRFPEPEELEAGEAARWVESWMARKQ